MPFFRQIYGIQNKRLSGSILSKDEEKAREPDAASISLLDRSIEKLCGIMRDFDEWFLVGGMGLDLNLGEITRMHHDFDIEAPSERFSELVGHMMKRGYGLFRKLMSMDVYPKKRAVVYERFSADSAPIGKEMRFVRLMGDKADERNDDMLSYIDVFFTRDTEKGREFGYNEKPATLPFDYASPKKIEREGCSIRLRNPAYQAYLKMGSKSQIDKYDLSNLEKMLGEDFLLVRRLKLSSA